MTKSPSGSPERGRPRLDVLLVGDLASIHVRRLAAGLAATGMTVTAAGFEGEPITGVRLVRLGSAGPADRRRYVTAIPALARLIRRVQPSVVNAHYLSSYGLMAAIALRLAEPVRRRAVLVQTVWGTDLLVTALRSRARRWLAKLALRSADLVTGDSDELVSEAAALAPRTRIVTFTFGPTRAVFMRTHTPERLVLSTRRLDPDTRVELIVRAFALARASGPDRLAGWRLIVAGNGSDAEHVRAAAAADAAVHLVGQLGADELASLLVSASVFVSIPVSDGTSAALLEAMAAGAIPIVNALPANLQWVDPSKGIIVARDPAVEEVAEAILEAAIRRSDSGIRDSVRSTAWEDQVDRLADTFKELSGSHGGGRAGTDAPRWVQP